MSRMTSDIENLQQLLQDGLAQFAIQGLTMVVITVILFATNVALALITVVLIVPGPDRRVGVVPAGLGARLRPGARRHRQCAGRPVREPARRAHRHRPQPAAPQRRSTTATWSATTGTPTTTPPSINAVYGPGTQLLGVLGQAVLLGHRRRHGARTTRCRIGALVAFFLYLNRFFPPIQLLVQQYNTYQQGQASVIKLRGLLDTEPERASKRPMPSSCRPSRARSPSTTCPSATTRPRPVHRRRRPDASRPARRWPSSDPPEPASRRWPSWSPASTTRPPGGCSSTATTCAT